MYARVAPLRRMPLNLSVLDYSIPIQLARVIPGQLVFIPFRKQSMPGLVVKVAESTELKISSVKPISSLISSEPFISQKQSDFLVEMADFYHTPLGFLAKINLLPWQKRKITALNLRPLEENQNTKTSQPIVYAYTSEHEKKDYLEKIFSSPGQNLILVPNIEILEKYKITMPDHIKQETVFISSSISTKELFSSWLAVRQNEKRIVIGTRSALFFPWMNLINIVIDDEANPDYKSWDMAPRFHTKDAALMLSFHHHSRLHLISHTPALDSYFFYKHHAYLGQSQPQPLKPGPIIINEREERRGGNYGFWSDDLKEAITKLPSDGSAFIFINRRGSANYVGCRDCGFVARCQKCGRSLVYHTKENNLQCHYCKISSPPLMTYCPDCHGVNVVMYGAGTELVENEARKIWGKSHKIIRFDSETADFINPEELASARIIIGTQKAWEKVDWGKIKVLAWLDLDSQLFIPEYQIAENIWQLLRSAQYRLGQNSQFFIQTSHPDHLLINAIHNPEMFYASEWEQRKILKYPPYAYLLRLYCGSQNLAEIKQKSHNLFNKLSTLTKENKDITISGPLEMTPQFFEGRYWQVIIVKMPYNFYKKYTKMIVKAVSEGWKVDPNPNTLLSLS